jgi:amino acid transporter, AAT family
MNQTAETEYKFNYIFGAINFAVVFGIVWLLWYVFMNPNGVMKLYTPMYGFALVVNLLLGIMLISKVTDFYPFSEEPAAGANPIGRGIGLTVAAVVLMLFLTYVVFWNFIGKYGVAYFSPASIVVSGGTGAEPLVARENACTAIIYFATAFLWIALIWKVGFGRWPWIETSRGVMAWSRLFAVLVFSILVYAILFHPHVCHLFYPAQNKAGVVPWWAAFAGTGSAFFSLGLMLCALSWIIMSDLLWEGYPWKFLDRDGEGTFAKGVLMVIVTSVLGVISCVIMLKIMNHYWMEPFEGGQYTDAPYFRFLHAGEISGFFILAAFVLGTYFNNFPNTKALLPRAIVRTVIAILGGMLFYLFYYSAAAELVLGKVPGIAQPDDTSLVWTMLFLSVIMIQAEFFNGWPLVKRK